MPIQCSKCLHEFDAPTSVSIAIDSNLKIVTQHFKCACGKTTQHISRKVIQQLIAVQVEERDAQYDSKPKIIKENIPVIFTIQCPKCESFVVTNIKTHHIQTKCGYPIYFKETYNCDECKRTFNKIKFSGKQSESLFMEIVNQLPLHEQTKYTDMICHIK